VTTEDDFQQKLDADPQDWQTRLVFADWLQERGDSRAEGYRALGRMRRVPTWAFRQPSSRAPWYLWLSDKHSEARASVFKQHAQVLRAAALPADWCRRMYLGLPKEARSGWRFELGWFGYGTSRREVEDAAARAFAKLPPQRRAKLLAESIAPKNGAAHVTAVGRKKKPRAGG
jgi:uncharacterized protein (TIGR02996 family)